MYLLRITNPPCSGINVVMSSEESLYPRRSYEATLTWGSGPLCLMRLVWEGLCLVSYFAETGKKNLPQVVISGIAGAEMNEFVMIISCKIM